MGCAGVGALQPPNVQYLLLLRLLIWSLELVARFVEHVTTGNATFAFTFPFKFLNAVANANAITQTKWTHTMKIKCQLKSKQTIYSRKLIRMKLWPHRGNKTWKINLLLQATQQLTNQPTVNCICAMYGALVCGHTAFLHIKLCVIFLIDVWF